MNILYIGGTGEISTSCVQRSLDAGHRVTVLNRGLRSALPEGVEQVVGEKDDPAVLNALAERHFDAVCQFILYTPEEIARDIDVFAGRCGQYVFISSASVYQKPAHGCVITEATPAENPFWEYSQNKIAMEQLLNAAHADGRIVATIVRPSHTYREKFPGGIARGDDWAWRMRNGRGIIVQGDGTSLWTWTHASDFSKPFVRLLGNGGAYGETFHITRHLEAWTWNDIIAAMGRALGVEPRIVHAPTDVLVRIDPANEGPLWGDKSYCALFDNAKVMSVAGEFTCDYSLDAGMASVAEIYFRDRAETYELDMNLHAKLDAICEAMKTVAI